MKSSGRWRPPARACGPAPCAGPRCRARRPRGRRSRGRSPRSGSGGRRATARSRAAGRASTRRRRGGARRRHGLGHRREARESLRWRRMRAAAGAPQESIGSRAGDLERRPRLASARARLSQTDPPWNGTIPPMAVGRSPTSTSGSGALSARVHGRRAADGAAHRRRHARPVHLLLRRRHARIPDRARDRARAHRGGDRHLPVADPRPDRADPRLDRRGARRGVDRSAPGRRRSTCRCCCSSATCRSRCWSRVLPICVAGIVILDLPALAIFPLLAGRRGGDGLLGDPALPRRRGRDAPGAARHQLEPLAAAADGLLGGLAAHPAAGRAAADQPDHRPDRRRAHLRRRRRLEPRPRRAGRAAGRDDDLARAHRAALEVDPAPAARSRRRRSSGSRRATTTSRSR